MQKFLFVVRPPERSPRHCSAGDIRKASGQKGDAFLADQRCSGEDLENHADTQEPSSENTKPMQRSNEQFFMNQKCGPFIQTTFGMIMNGPIATIRTQ